MAEKAVLLVTNQLQFLPYVDKIVVMGRVEGGGGDVGVIDQVGRERGREGGRERGREGGFETVSLVLLIPPGSAR